MWIGCRKWVLKENFIKTTIFRLADDKQKISISVVTIKFQRNCIHGHCWWGGGGLRDHYCGNIRICDSWVLSKFHEHSLPINQLSEQIMKPNLHLSFKQENPWNYNLTKCKQLSIEQIRNDPCWIPKLPKWYNVQAIFKTRAWTLGSMCQTAMWSMSVCFIDGHSLKSTRFV